MVRSEALALAELCAKLECHPQLFKKLLVALKNSGQFQQNRHVRGAITGVRH